MGKPQQQERLCCACAKMCQALVQGDQSVEWCENGHVTVVVRSKGYEVVYDFAEAGMTPQSQATKTFNGG